MNMFIDRKKELSILQEIDNARTAQLVIVYGRRRVGKSRLLTEFVNTKKGKWLYLMADLTETILETLSSQIEAPFTKFSTWNDFFDFLNKSKYTGIIIDEFQYLYHVNKAWPSILQRWWEKLKQSEKKIILCGSMIATIDKIARGHGSALYGRKTREIELQPLPFHYAREFVKQYAMADAIKVYSILGGIPRYLEEWDVAKTIEENLRKKIFERTSFLYNEPMNLLFEEFRDPAAYISILTSISQGYVKFNEIAEMSHIASTKLPRYLIVLERAGIIGKEIPITERKLKTKTTRYQIRDNFYRFWYTFVFRNRPRIEWGKGSEIVEDEKEALNSYVGKAFEEICKEFLLFINDGKWTKMGHWWSGEKEIDIVAINEKKREVLCAECKWKENVNPTEVLKALQEKTAAVDWHNQTRKEEYVIFAKSFSSKKETGAMLFDITDMERMWTKGSAPERRKNDGKNIRI